MRPVVQHASRCVTAAVGVLWVQLAACPGTAPRAPTMLASDWKAVEKDSLCTGLKYLPSLQRG
jgi:hypothetical protein